MTDHTIGRKLRFLMEERDVLRTAGIIVISIVLALFAGSFFILALGIHPLAAYKQLLIYPFTGIHGIGEVLTKITPILIIGIGVALPLNAGLINLGGDGQFYMGALGMILVSNALRGSAPWLIVPLGILAGCFTGALWGALAGWFKAHFGASEIITTLMLNYIAVQVIGFLVHGPLKEPGGIMPQTLMIPEGGRLIRFLPGTRVHIGIFIALGCVILYWFIIRRTMFGYRLRVIGGSLKAANYSGIREKTYYLSVMALSGAFAGLAGAIEINGIHFRLLEDISANFGFTGMVVALLGVLNPVGIFLASLIMSALSAGAEIMQVGSGVPVTLVYALQGLIVLFVLWGKGFKRSKSEVLSGKLKQQRLPVERGKSHV